MFDNEATMNVPVDENQSEITECSTESLNRTFESGENTEKLTTVMNQGSRTITRPIKPRETINTNGSLNTTRTMVRERQKTMVVESQLVSDVRRILSEAKINEIPELAGLERNLISTLQKHENDVNAKLYEATSKSSSPIESLLYKHFNADLRKMVRLLLSEVQKSGGPGNTCKACDGSCDYSRKLRLDLESAAVELDNLHQEYSKLYENFGKSRNLLHLQKKEYVQLETVLNEERQKYKQLMEKFVRLREDATRKLEHASQEIVSCENKHEENTKGLRLKVKAFELEIKNLRETVELKRKENDDLQRMLRSIVTDLEVNSDLSESEQ
ncbi:unnamed protein product [Auanema sp. JU1783]|nr:unnamed protein product [Auanema sp. JU1783]